MQAIRSEGAAEAERAVPDREPASLATYEIGQADRRAGLPLQAIGPSPGAGRH